jgi:hypothetical protein
VRKSLKEQKKDNFNESKALIPSKIQNSSPLLEMGDTFLAGLTRIHFCTLRGFRSKGNYDQVEYGGSTLIYHYTEKGRAALF